jgi:hypothetical protein
LAFAAGIDALKLLDQANCAVYPKNLADKRRAPRG